MEYNPSMADSSMSASQENPEKQFILLHPIPLVLCLRGAVVLLVALVILRWQGIIKLSSHFIGGASRDAGLYIWLTQTTARDLFELPWFHTQAFYPYSGSLAWSDNFILVGLLAKLLFSIGVSLPLAYNLLLLGAQFLNGLFTYYFCLRLTGSQAPSLVAGCAFLSLSYFSCNLGHPQLMYAFWIPAAISSLFSFLSRPHFIPAIVSGLMVVGAFLTTVYFALFILISFAIICLGVALLHPRHYRPADYFLFFGGIAVGLIPLVLFAQPYLSVREVFGERAIYEAYYFSATALSYVAFSPFSLIYNWTSGVSHDEAFLGCGLFLLIFATTAFGRAFGVKRLRLMRLTFIAFFCLACVFSLEDTHQVLQISGATANYLCAVSMWGALISLCFLLFHLGSLERDLGVSLFTNRDLMAIFIFLAVTAFLLSLGPQGNPEKGHVALGIYRLLYEIMPGFNSIRAISRIGILVLFAFCVLLALALNYCKHKLAWGPRLLAGIGVAIFLENAPQSIPVEEPLPAPSVLEVLRNESKANDVILFLPMAPGTQPNGQVKSWGDYAHVNTTYMNWAFPLHRPIVNGYSGQRSKLMREYPGQLAQFPDNRSRQVLASIGGLRFVVFSSQFDPSFNPQMFASKIESAKDSLRYILGDAQGNYLFEYIGDQNLSLDSYSLWVPGCPRRSLQLELKALYDSKINAATVDIRSPDTILDIAFHTVQVTTNGEWSWYHVDLPPCSDPVRPHRLTFSVSPPEAQVFLRRTEVTVQDPP